MIGVNLSLFIISCALLVVSGSWLVKSLTKIASYLRLSEFVAAFIIMAFATSIPELFVGITAALAKNPALLLGTVIGSNIADLTIIIGIGIILARNIKIESDKTRKDALYMFFIILLPVILMLIGGKLSRIDGIILLGAFGVYIWKLLKERAVFTKLLEDSIRRKDVVLNTALLILSIILLLVSANFVVKYATLLSIDLALPAILIGLFLIAIGTSLPELIFGIQAITKGHGEMALGNLIGSVIVNSTLVLAVTAIIYPITVHFQTFLISATFMIVIAFLFSTFVESGGNLHWKEGISLLLLYMFFIIVELYTGIITF